MSGKSEIEATEKEAGSKPSTRLDEALAALGFMTRLPVPYREARLADAAWAFPLAGVVVGGLAGVVLWLSLTAGLPTLAAAILALAVSALATGALHEDGLADCADGFWGGHTPERCLEIMRDSRSGAFGILALILITGLKAALIATLAERTATAGALLVAIHTMPRGLLPVAMHGLPLAAKTGLAAMAGRPSVSAAAVSVILALGVSGAATMALPLWTPILLLLAAAAACALVGALARAKLKGLNGDSLGSMEQIGEVACLVALVPVLG